MKIRFRWTNVVLRTALVIAGFLLLAATQGQVVHFVYQGY